MIAKSKEGKILELLRKNFPTSLRPCDIYLELGIPAAEAVEILREMHARRVIRHLGRGRYKALRKYGD